MEKQFQKQAGVALIIGSILMIATMIFHPVGGNIDYLVKISTTIIVTHSLAILSIPISIYGFWGLTKRLGASNIFSLTAFIIMVIGLFAAMLAATINGLALPSFVLEFQQAEPDTAKTMDMILHYGFSLNQAFTMIYIFGSCLAVLNWSIIILKTKTFPAWLGIMGISLGIIAIIMILSGFVFSDLTGLRIFVFGWLTWVLVNAYFLITKSSEHPEDMPLK